MHLSNPAVGALLPGVQAVGATEPVAHALPGGQAVHSAALPKSVALEKVPASHGSAAAEPAAQ